MGRQRHPILIGLVYALAVVVGIAAMDGYYYWVNDGLTVRQLVLMDGVSLGGTGLAGLAALWWDRAKRRAHSQPRKKDPNKPRRAPMSNRAQWQLYLAIVVVVGSAFAILLGARLHDFLLFAAFLAVIVGLLLVTDTRGRSDSIVKALVMPTDGGVLVIDDAKKVPMTGDGVDLPDDRRLSSRRLVDGHRVGRVAGLPGLHLLGAGPELLWCASRDSRRHTRDPATLHMEHDELGTPPDYDKHEHTRDAFHDGVLTVTQLLDPASPHPTFEYRTRTRYEIISFRRDAAHWEAAFPPSTISRATHLFVTPTRVVFLLGGKGEHPSALALDAASGAVAWRARL